MKKILAVAAVALSLNAHADVSNLVVKDQMCKDQAMMAVMLADAKAKNQVSLVNPDSFRANAGLHELVLNMDRIAENHKGQDLATVGKVAWAWCMDNIETIVFKNRR